MKYKIQNREKRNKIGGENGNRLFSSSRFSGFGNGYLTNAKKEKQFEGGFIMKRFTVVILALALMGLAGMSMAQSHDINITINGISLIGLNNANQVDFEIEAPALAGDPPDVSPASDATKEIYYTSLVGTGEECEIQAEFTEGLPAGLNLNVAVASPADGKGTLGTFADFDFTSTALGPENLVTAIGTCYSSRTAGAVVTYTLTVPDADLANLVTQAATNHDVTYTLTAAH